MILRNLLVFLALITLASCSKDDENTGNVPEILTGLDSKQDDDGNLIIRNYSGRRLVLFRTSSEQPLKIIPNSTEEFLVGVDISGQIQNPIVDLAMYEYEDVQVDSFSVENTDPFVRWNVALSPRFENGDRVLWIVSKGSEFGNAGSNVATVELIYPGGTNNQVEVRTNSDIGLLGSLIPGNKFTIGLPYDNYTLSYHYFTSNPNDISTRTDVGVIDMQLINEVEVPITLILNSSNAVKDVIIPHYGTSSEGGTGADERGFLRVTNKLVRPIRIYYGNQLLIENVATVEGSSENISTIDINQTQEYELPYGNYTFTAKYWDTDAFIESEETTINSNVSAWIIE